MVKLENVREIIDGALDYPYDCRSHDEVYDELTPRDIPLTPSRAAALSVMSHLSREVCCLHSLSTDEQRANIVDELTEIIDAVPRARVERGDGGYSSKSDSVAKEIKDIISGEKEFMFLSTDNLDLIQCISQNVIAMHYPDIGGGTHGT